MKHSLLFGILFGAGLLVGYGFGCTRSSPVRAVEVPGEAAGAEHRALPANEGGISLTPSGPSSEDLISSLASAAHEQDYLKGRVAMYQLIEQISPSEIPDVIQSAKRLPPKTRKMVVAALVEHWLQTDSAAAGAWISAHLTDEASLAWARISPSEALAALIAAKHDVRPWEAPQIALDHLAGKDPHARLSLLRALPASANRDYLLQQEVVALAKTNPADAIQAASINLTGRLRTEAVHATLLEWVKKDPTAATAQVASMFPELKPGLFGNDFISNFTRSMAENDPAAALEFASSLPEEFRTYPLIAATAAWAKTEPLAALAWARENGVDITNAFRTERGIEFDTVLRSAMEGHREETIDWLIGMPSGAEQQKLIKKALQGTAWSEDEITIERMLEPGSSIFRLFNALPPEEQAHEANRLGKMIAVKGTFPDEAQWTSLFGNEAARQEAMAGAIGIIFSSQSADRGEALLARLPEGISRDLALKEIVFAQAYQMPDQAVQRALQITNRDVQRAALNRTVPGWLLRNEAACRAWLDSAEGIPAEWIAEWMKDARKR